MEYKPEFTLEEINELEEWFRTHRCEQQVDLGNGIHVSELDKTLPPMFNVAKKKYANRIFSGQIFLLFRIRDELIRQNKATKIEN